MRLEVVENDTGTVPPEEDCNNNLLLSLESDWVRQMFWAKQLGVTTAYPTDHPLVRTKAKPRLDSVQCTTSNRHIQKY